MAVSFNFGEVLSVLIASVLLPFFPITPIQLLVQSLLYDIGQLSIPYDNVDKEYSTKLFDNFAPTYEKTLQNIKYNLPQEIQNTLGSPKGLIIDLGCGTGKIAERLKSADNTFIGIDISQKMLTTTLKTLAEDGFVTRAIYPEVPPRVEYSLTERAFSLLPHIRSLVAWAKDNMEPIMRDRKKAAGSRRP